MLKRIKWAIDGRDSKWGSVRKAHLVENKYCEACDSGNDLEVHHIKPFHIFPMLELEPSNLMTLCKHCHLVLGHLRNFKLYNSDLPKYVMDFKNRKYVAELGVFLNESK